MKTSTRGIIVLAATIAIQITVGIAYVWSAFQVGIANVLFGGRQQLASLTFSLMLASLAISSVFAGKLAARFSTRVVVIAGGIVAGIGFITAGLVRPEFGWLLWITYGILGGAGMGFTYATTIACTQKWYPHKKGLVTGLVVAALGVGTAAFAPLVELMVRTFNESPNTSVGGEFLTFMILGGVILFVCVVGGIFMKAPPEGYLKEAPSPKEPELLKEPIGTISDGLQRNSLLEPVIADAYIEKYLDNELTLDSSSTENSALAANQGEYFLEDECASERATVYGLHAPVKLFKKRKPREFIYRNYSPLKMIKTPQYWLITLAFCLACLGGLMLIGFARPIADLHNVGSNLAVIAILAVGLSNAAGRLIWGAVSDRLGRINTIFILLGATALLAPFIAVIPYPYSAAVFVLIAIIGFCYGGILAIFPSLTAELFGSKNLATNYGLVLLGFGVGAIIASQVGGIFHNSAVYYNNVLLMLPAFLMATGTAVAAGLLLMGVKIMNRSTRKKIALVFLNLAGSVRKKFKKEKAVPADSEQPTQEHIAWHKDIEIIVDEQSSQEAVVDD